MKRIIAFLLSFVMLFCALTMLNGCTKHQTAISLANWLSLINRTFGMVNYTQDEPYFSNIDNNNKNYADVQIATEWGVIKKNEKIDLQKNITWKKAIVTLVNAGDFIKSDASEEDKFKYGINNFGLEVRDYWENREVTYDNAITLLGNAHKLWANRTYKDPVEEIEYKDGIKDLSSEKYKIDNYETEGNNVTIKKSSAGDIDLKIGDIYLLPANADTPGMTAHRVANVEEKNDCIVIENDPIEPELEDVTENIFVQETIVPNSKNAVIYDGNGNKLTGSVPTIQPQSNALNSRDSLVVNLAKTDYKNSELVNLSSKIANEFKVDDWNVKLEYSLGDSFGLEATVGQGKDETGKWEIGFGIDNFKVTNEIDYQWFQLKSASVRVDYDAKLKFKTSISEKPVNAVVAPYNNGNGKGLTNIKKVLSDNVSNVVRDKNSKGAKTIKIFSVDIWSIGVARVCLDVNLVIKIDGSISINITSHDAKGIEYKNNNIRFINTSDKEVDAQAQAKIEATIGIGPALYTIGLKKPIIGAQAKFGAGAAASVTVHLVDPEEHLIEEATGDDLTPDVYKGLIGADITTDVDSIRRTAEAQGGTYTSESDAGIQLHCDVCIDISLYWIIRVELTEYSFAADLLGKNGKIKLSHEFLGEKTGKFAHAHIENFDFIAGFSNVVYGSSASSKELCTKKYKNFANGNNEQKDESNNDNDMILKGEQIILSEIRISISEGKKYYPTVQMIPKGYELKDLKIKSENEKVAQVNNDGSITAISEGSTKIVVYTYDNKYSAYCALNVVSNSRVEFTELV